MLLYSNKIFITQKGKSFPTKTLRAKNALTESPAQTVPFQTINVKHNQIQLGT